MDEPITLRPRFARVLTVVVEVICVVAIVTLVVSGDFAHVIRYIWPLALLGFVVWMLYWSPSLTVDPGGVVIRNLVREHRVTWPAIKRIDTKYALTLYTARGRYVAWSAPAPSIIATVGASRADLKGLPESTYGAGGGIRPGDLPTSESGEAGLIVRRRYEALRDAGRLDGGVEGTGVVTRWIWPNVVTLGALIVATALGFLL